MRPCVCARRPAAEAPTDGKPSRLRPDNSCSHPECACSLVCSPSLTRVHIIHFGGCAWRDLPAQDGAMEMQRAALLMNDAPFGCRARVRVPTAGACRCW